jgi:hypothetical protein
MVYLIEKKELPKVSYARAEYKDDIVMMGVTQAGVALLFPGLDEALFVEWDEIIAYAAVAPRKTIPKETEEPAKKSQLREVKPGK